MRPSRGIWLVTLCALLLSAFSPAAFASWVCEGRTCGTSLFFCCCVSPQGQQDANCDDTGGGDRSGAAGANGGTAACPAGCNCTLTLRTADANRNTPAVSVAAPVVAAAMPPAAPTFLGPVPSELVARATELRGPPICAPYLATPALRGPPALTFPLIGS